MLERCASALDFDYCAYGIKVPIPLTRQRYVLVNNYPSRWRAIYRERAYLNVDPTVRHCLFSQRPAVWSDALFASAPDLWEEARGFGLAAGWCQSSVTRAGVAGMLTFARSGAPLGPAELRAKLPALEWLVSLTHVRMCDLLLPRVVPEMRHSPTTQERQVLRWSADGKTCSEIAEIMRISERTVTFHVRNSVDKLAAANKLGAVVKAMRLGFLD